ncbi:hypothetical protein GCM10023188_02670 [Pontibacter saemangeumensis]|uniref:SpoIIAA-like n=1 Tax=Pontibacter saemangeumensis TaxID=1084525 RepID=A0ABP8L7D8_9BACT
MYNTDPHTAPEESKIVVAHNPCYELIYDNSKNRIYLTVKGFWKNREAVPHFLDDLQKALRLVKPDFSLLSDLRTMLTHPQRLSSLHIEAHNLIKLAGLSKAAIVVPIDRIATLQVEEINSKSTMSSENFSSVVEAEIWLTA